MRGIRSRIFLLARLARSGISLYFGCGNEVCRLAFNIASPITARRNCLYPLYVRGMERRREECKCKDGDRTVFSDFPAGIELKNETFTEWKHWLKN